MAEKPFHSLPLSTGMDGFFCCVLKKVRRVLTRPDPTDKKSSARIVNKVKAEEESHCEPAMEGQVKETVRKATDEAEKPITKKPKKTADQKEIKRSETETETETERKQSTVVNLEDVDLEFIA